MASSCTPAAKKARRHSAVVGSGSSAKATKRTKTTNVTYGSSNKNTGVAGSRQFDALQDEGLPGTLQANFANHEPVVMFRDTGSTIADNESSQQRMVEQAINHGKKPDDVTESKPQDSDKLESSPFPWAVSSVPTQTPGGNASKQSPRDKATPAAFAAIGPGSSSRVATNVSSVGQSDTAPGTGMLMGQNVAEPDRPSLSQAVDREVMAEPSLVRKHSSPTVLKEGDTVAEQDHPQSPKKRAPLNSSPQVSVPRVRVKTTTQSSDRPDEVPKGRKRKASAANLESLDSDDRAIGHPKELYQPRLSRRRATGVVEQPQDFSIVPEKAAKRRRKTVNTKSVTADLADDELSYDHTTVPQTKAMPIDRSGDAAASISHPKTADAAPAIAEKSQPGREEVRAVLKELNFPLKHTSFDDGVSERPSPTKDASPLSAKKVCMASVASMPPPPSAAMSTSPTKKQSNAAAAATFAMPPPTSSASRKSRRSHTTIFEDHVDFSGSQQRSPSLRQQQASRKSAALKEVKNDATQATRRKRRTIVQDDEDDEDDEDGEDELVKDPVVEEPVPKKRCRLAKAPAAKPAPPAEEVLQDSDAEPDELEIVEPPKKKGRMAKAPAAKTKSADRVLEDSEAEFDEPELEVEEPPKKKAGRRPSRSKAGELATEVRAATDGGAAADHGKSRQTFAASKPSATSSSEKHTPPPTKDDAAQNAVVPTKSAPATHTPIKTSSKVVHRVGLNRRQRVQPLLKMVRPPAPTKKR